MNPKRIAAAVIALAVHRAPFIEAEWNLATLEPRSGRYPGQR